MDLFGTAGIRGPVADRVTPELALAVGRAAGHDGGEFVVARDGRTTGPALAAAMAAGLAASGATVRLAGTLPTPALAFASRDRRGAMLTASHNPPADNGIKLFADGVEYDRDAERRVEARVERQRGSPVGGREDGAEERGDRVAGAVPWHDWGGTEPIDVLESYREAVAGYVRERGADADGLRVAVDCGNGMASLATPQVLRELGAGVVTLNANVDGHFPGRPSKPTPETLADLREFVADGDFDLAFGADGDADRVVVVDGDGAVVHEDTVVAVLAHHYVAASDDADPVVVTTPNASGRIDERVEAAGGRVERVRLGALHEGIAAAREAGGGGTRVVFAAEPWKHVHPAFGGWIDGVASAAVVAGLVADAGGLATLRDPVTERPYRKVSVDCPDDRKAAAMERLEREVPALFPVADVDTEYGVRADLPDGSWVLVRPSGTEPYVRVYAESDGVGDLVSSVVGVVEDAVAAADRASGVGR